MMIDDWLIDDWMMIDWWLIDWCLIDDWLMIDWMIEWFWRMGTPSSRDLPTPSRERERERERERLHTLSGIWNAVKHHGLEHRPHFWNAHCVPSLGAGLLWNTMVFNRECERERERERFSIYSCSIFSVLFVYYMHAWVQADWLVHTSEIWNAHK